jgi:hypothetical protein
MTLVGIRTTRSSCRRDRYDPRLNQLIAMLSPRLRSASQWLLLPSSTWIRIPAGILLICGGLLSFLPILGLWMLPLGLLLLAEDVPPLRSTRTRILDWIERRRPRWLAPDGHRPRDRPKGRTLLNPRKGTNGELITGTTPQMESETWACWMIEKGEQRKDFG